MGQNMQEVAGTFCGRWGDGKGVGVYFLVDVSKHQWLCRLLLVLYCNCCIA